ncbi:hypothetical protein [Butyrivibrio sp. NC2002]|uniref:hypothetical protein n=1 Tax=Butyrivibrio sp. NC2002 TaxID=1410610 RepID=UPI0005655998|nr:hypothetical protein [Butyrivibrio sp. NC2002]
MGIFGLFSSDDEHDVRLTDSEIEKLTKNMSRSEKKEFYRRQEELERDRADKEAWLWAMGDWDEND